MSAKRYAPWWVILAVFIIGLPLRVAAWGFQRADRKAREKREK